jgi:glycine cleavage system H protein
MSDPYQPPGHMPGQHVPGTTVPIPYAMEQVRRAQDAAYRAQQTAAAEAVAVRHAQLAGRWFTPEHEWITVSGQTVTVGIADYVTGLLGSLVYVSLPAVGATVAMGAKCAELESMKTIGEVHAPVDGRVIEVNGRLEAEPELVSAEPFGDGWLFRVEVGPNAQAALSSDLLSPDEYEELTRNGG